MSTKSRPAEALAQVRTLGQRLRIARKRRGWTIAETAARAGINRNTLNALELGKPGVAISALASVLWVLGLVATLGSVAHPDLDAHGKALDAARRPRRARARRAARDDFDF